MVQLEFPRAKYPFLGILHFRGPFFLLHAGKGRKGMCCMWKVFTFGGTDGVENRKGESALDTLMVSVISPSLFSLSTGIAA